MSDIAKSGLLKIDANGKLWLGGEVFDDHGSYPVQCCIDTGCTYDLVLEVGLANAVCAPVEKVTSVSAAAGSFDIKGQIRKLNIRFGDLIAKDILAFVPNESSRNLMGIGFLQKMGAFLAIDFHSDATLGGMVTSNRDIPLIVGKVLHCLLVHEQSIVSKSPCPFCRKVGS